MNGVQMSAGESTQSGGRPRVQTLFTRAALVSFHHSSRPQAPPPNTHKRPRGYKRASQVEPADPPQGYSFSLSKDAVGVSGCPLLPHNSQLVSAWTTTSVAVPLQYQSRWRYPDRPFLQRSVSSHQSPCRTLAPLVPCSSYMPARTEEGQHGGYTSVPACPLSRCRPTTVTFCGCRCGYRSCCWRHVDGQATHATHAAAVAIQRSVSVKVR